jgi:hypothetical protein
MRILERGSAEEVELHEALSEYTYTTGSRSVTQDPFPHFTDSRNRGATDFTNRRSARMITWFFAG